MSSGLLLVHPYDQTVDDRMKHCLNDSTGDLFLPTARKELRVHSIIFGELALFS